MVKINSELKSEGLAISLVEFDGSNLIIGFKEVYTNS